MNWEGFKTLLLTALVLLSFLLTWNLWTYETNSNQIEKPNFVSSAISPKNGKRKLGAVVHPYMAVLQQDDEYNGLMSGTALEQLFQTIAGAQFHDIKLYGNNITNPKLSKGTEEPKSGGIEMRFQAAIPFSLFGSILQGSNDGGKNNVQVFLSSTIPFDRIVFYKADPNQGQATKMLAFFKNGKTPVGTAKVSNISFADLKHFYTKKNVTTLIKKKDFYLPAEPKLKELNYLGGPHSGYHWIDVSKFKRALFDDPNYVVEQPRNYFASTSEIMQVKDHILQFTSEPGTQQKKGNSQNGSPVIQKSFNYVNGHSGWTDDYMLFGYQRPKNPNPNSRASVTFRLMIGKGQTKYPVFGQITGSYPLYSDAGTIQVILEKGTVYKYIRTLMVLEKPDYSTSADLATGEQIWEQLKSSKNVQMKLVKDIRVGYNMKNGFTPKQNVETFTPKWFVLYKGHWETATQLINGKSKQREAVAK